MSETMSLEEFCDMMLNLKYEVKIIKNAVLVIYAGKTYSVDRHPISADAPRDVVEFLWVKK
jgi:hypothetical protein